MPTPPATSGSPRGRGADRTSSTRASRPSAPAADAAAEPGAAPRLDGRRVHIVDRALDYAALAAAGLSAARIARKRRRSAGYVSILLRLGQAIQSLEPAELAALRSPRITWKLAQRIVRTDADVGSIRHQLRLALGGFSTHNVDRRKHRVGRGTPGAAGSGTGEKTGRPGAAWGWDESWFTRDPVDFVRHHLAHLTAVHRSVDTRAHRHSALRSARRLSVGQSLAALQRSLASTQSAARSATHDPAARALAALAILELRLEAAQEEIEALLAAGTAPTPPPRPPISVGPASALEIDEDLA